jgi:thymidylate synthase (FAD)
VHKVQLDWVTPDAERVIARHARVSAKNPDKAEFTKLLKYCIRHSHWSIFEQASASFEIITSRAISAQIIRLNLLIFKS